MGTTCETFQIADLEKDHFNKKASFLFKMWRRQMKAQDCSFEEFVPHSPELIVLGKPKPCSPMANLVFSGEKTIGARLFGQNLEKTSAKLYASLEQKSLQNYSEVVSVAQNDSFETCEPVYDYVSSHVNGQRLSYERLLLPFKTKEGPVFLVGYSMPVSEPSF